MKGSAGIPCDYAINTRFRVVCGLGQLHTQRFVNLDLTPKANKAFQSYCILVTISALFCGLPLNHCSLQGEVNHFTLRPHEIR